METQEKLDRQRLTAFSYKAWLDISDIARKSESLINNFVKWYIW